MNKREQRESLTGSVLAQITRESEAVLAEAELPEHITEELHRKVLADTNRVLDSLTLAELQSEAALERYVESCLLSLQMEVHQLQFNARREKPSD